MSFLPVSLSPPLRVVPGASNPVVWRQFDEVAPPENGEIEMETAVFAAVGAIFVVLLLVIGYLVVRLNRAEGQQRPTGSERTPSSRRSGRSGSGNSRGNASVEDPEQINWLIGQTGDVEGMSFHIGDRVASIGREYKNDIQVSAETASERHALLMGDTHGLKLTDLGSSNGTILNGDRIEPHVEYDLDNGDEFKIGNAVFLYHRQGRYTDDTRKQKKAISTQKKTTAMAAVQERKEMSLKEQVLRAVKDTEGDFEAAAEQVDLDVDIVKRIVHRAVNK